MQEVYRHIASLDSDDFNRTFDTNRKCLDYIIRVLYDGEVRSPFCDSKVYPMREFGRYKCARTKRSFYITKGTIFYKSHIPLHKWFAILYSFAVLREKLTPTLLMRIYPATIKTMKTAIYVLERISWACQTPVKAMFGNSQADETPVGGHQAVRSYPDKCPKRVYKGEDKRNILCIAEEGKEGWMHFECVNDPAKDLPAIVSERVGKGATVTTDDTNLFNPVNSDYDHRTCNHGRRLFTNDGDNSNLVENRIGQMKRSMDGSSHNNIRFEHAGRYCAVYSFSSCFRRQTCIQRFKTLLYNCFQRETFHPLSKFKLPVQKRAHSGKLKKDGGDALRPGPLPQTPRHRNPEAYTDYVSRIKEEILYDKALKWYGKHHTDGSRAYLEK